MDGVAGKASLSRCHLYEMRDVRDRGGESILGSGSSHCKGPERGLCLSNSTLEATKAPQCFSASAILGSLTKRHVTPTHPLTVLHHTADVLQRLEVLGVYGAKLHNLIIHLQTLKEEEKWKTRLEVKRASGVLYPSIPSLMSRARACSLQGTMAGPKQRGQGLR